MKACIELVLVIIHTNREVWLATPTMLPSAIRNNFFMEMYYFVQAAVSVIRNSEVVLYSGAATVLRIWRVQLGVSINRESTAHVYL